VQSGSKEFFGIRQISEDLALIRDTQYISVIDLKRNLCFPVFQTLFITASGTHDFYFETETNQDQLIIHTLGSKRIPNSRYSNTQMLRYDVSIQAIREFVSVLK